jgi:hypothetical protein
MWRNVLLVLGLLAGFASPVVAASTDEQIAASVVAVAVCSKLKSDTDRLACFDKAAEGIKNLGNEESKTASTKEIVATYAATDFKVVDPDDVHIAPGKFIGKPIEVRNVRCLYADRSDYRCVAPSRMGTVFFVKDVSPAAAKEALETDCGAIKNLNLSKCRRVIHVVPEDFHQDLTDGYSKRTVVTAKAIEVVSGATSRQR